MARTQVPVTDLGAPKATLTTSLTGANNDLEFTAKRGGAWGNSIQVAYINPGAASQSLSVVVTGFLITVNLATNGSSAITSTATDIMTAVTRAQDAGALVDVALAGSDTGAGVVTALAATALTGGSYGKALPAVTNGDSVNGHYLTGNDGQVILQLVSTDAGPQTVTLKRAAGYQGGVPVDDETVTVAAGATLELGPFSPGEFNQNAAKDVYFTPSVSGTLDFRAYRVTKAT